MIIKPRGRGFICTTAHPVGCAKNVADQIRYVQEKGLISGPKNVLVIGASTGYGLASRIVAAFGCRANTLGVFFERPADGNRTASAGWYNTAAFEMAAQKAGLYAKSINGDAFSDAIKQQVISVIKNDWHGKVDMVIYSLASPKRQHPKTGEVFSSVLKPIGHAFENKTVDLGSGAVSTIKIEPATPDEIQHTTTVMGGEDWQMWIDALSDAHVLAKGAITLAYDYIGPEITYPIYRNGTIGRAKEHLEATGKQLHQQLQKSCGGHAYVSVNKCLVTQASAAIPVVPLYGALLYKVMKAKGTHEGCIEQMQRLFAEKLNHAPIALDDEGRIRLDNLEMQPDIQDAVKKAWLEVTTDNIDALSDIQGFRSGFYNLFGFEREDVDYDAEVDPEVSIPSIKTENV